MNFYIKSQIKNMLILVENFKKTCLIVAKKDDDIIDDKEKELLKQINKACDEFISKLSRMR